MPAPILNLWQMAFFAGAALFILFQAVRGWRLGLIRQLVEIFAVACSYGAAYLLGPFAAPLFRSFSLPDPVLKVVAGSAVGFIVYLFIRLAGAVIFKRTGQQRFWIIRFGFGMSGAIVGGLFAVFTLWIVTFGIRLGGSLAESRVKLGDAAAAAGKAVYKAAEPSAPQWLQNLVHLKEALESGAPGAVVKQIDPLPQGLYSTIGRICALIQNDQNVERFLSFPGVQPLAGNPKILALRNDPQIARDVAASNYLGLLRNEHVVQLLNDPDVMALFKRLDVQKALDYALSNAEKPSNVPAPR